MILNKLITNHYFLTIQQNNKTDSETKNSQIRNYFKIEDYYKMRLTNKTGKTIHLTRKRMQLTNIPFFLQLVRY